MQLSAVIYQYTDGKVIDTVSMRPDPVLARAYAVPENIPVRVLTNSGINYFSKKNLSYAFRTIIGMSMIAALLLLSPFMYMEAKFRLDPPVPQAELDLSEITVVDSVIDTPTFTKLLHEKYIKKLNPVNTEYALVIPKIGVNSPVIAQVDPNNQAEYQEALKKGAAQAKGTVLPNEYGSQYIFAHSTDYFWNIGNYNAIFYLLKDVEVDDQVYIVYKEQLFPYRVSEKRVVNADDTYYLKPNSIDNRLILQTCWPPGTTWKRMLVIATPIESPLETNGIVSYSLDKSKTK